MARASRADCLPPKSTRNRARNRLHFARRHGRPRLYQHARPAAAPAIGLLITALCSALVVKAVGVLGFVNLNSILALLRELDFRAVLLDGIGVVLFLAVLTKIEQGVVPGAGAIARLLGVEIIGGLAFGLGLGWVAVRMLRQIDEYQTELLLTLAFAFAGFTLARYLHVSSVFGMVVIGRQGGDDVISAVTKQRLDDVWELIDEFLNAGLFVLIGVEILVIDVRPSALFRASS